MIADFDLAIVGAGFGGSLLAMVARRIGLSVLLVERGSHPRFAVGESTSPLTNLLLEQLARRYDLPRLLPLTTYGEWQRTYPQVACGLKRGFTYYKHEAGEHFRTRDDRANELLVAASPNDEVSDTHWYRADVDYFLLNEAIALGCDYTDRTEATLSSIGAAGGALKLERAGRSWSVNAGFIVDATGPRGFLHRSLGLTSIPFAGFPSTQALFSHFTGVPTTAEMGQFSSPDEPPYAPDAAALHHVFDDGWMWVLRFNNGITSAGVSLTAPAAEELNLAEGEPAWRRLLSRYPTVGEQFSSASPTRDFIYSPSLAFRSNVAAGEGWALLPSAAAFVDPLFSTGIPLTLIGIERIGRIFEHEWGGEGMGEQLAEYAELTLGDADWTATFVGGCFAAMAQFGRFVDYSMYYFAAASFSEMARRLDRRDLASRFLLQNRADFAAGLTAGAQLLRSAKATHRNVNGDGLAAEVCASISASNIAGLCDPQKRNWYGVEWEDLIRASNLLGLTQTEMRSVLDQADWASFDALSH